MSSLATLEAEMAGLHDAAAPSPVAEQLLLAARTARNLLDQHEARLVAILDRHANHGSGPCPEEVFAASGCSSHEARAAAGRARILIGLNNSLTDTVADSLVGDADDAHPSDQDTDHSGTNGNTSGGSNDDNASDGSDSR